MSSPKEIWCIEGMDLTPVWGINNPVMGIVSCFPHPDYRCPDDHWHVKGFEDKADAIKELHIIAEKKLKLAQIDFIYVHKKYPLCD